MAVPATIIFVALRIALPLFLAIDVLFWYTASSLVKVMLFLILPHVRLPVTNTKQGCTSIFLMTVLVVNCLMFVSRLAAYIVFSIIELPVNSTIGIILDLLGMSTYSLDLWEQVLHIMLEILIICTVIIVLIELHQLPTTRVNALTSSQIKTRRRLFFVGKCMLAISLCLTGIQLPSVLNAVYYVAFVVVMTMWFGCKQRRIHPCTLYGLCAFIMVHIMLVLVAQILYRFELMVSTFANWCRYLGIVEMVKHGSLQPYRQSLVNLRVCTGPNQLMKTFRQGFVNLLFLMWLNYLLGTMMFFFSKPEIFNRKEPEDSPQKKIPKPHEIKISHRATSAESLQLQFRNDMRVLQEEFSLRRRASVVSGMEGVSRFLSSSTLNKILDDYKKEKKEVEDKEKDNNEWHNFWLDTLTLLKKMSFMSAHVAMLAWSIHFYSWLAGGMLFWFFIVGMLPNTRAVTETFAPVILFYAIFLIAVDYFYSMDLTEQERPESPVLRVIGFRKPRRLVWSLLFKNVYTLFFWLLLYHWTGCPKKHDIFSSPDHGTEYKSRVGVWLSQRMSPFISRFWIWLVMTVLLLYGFNALSHDDFIQLEQIFFLFLLVTSMIVMQISFHAWCRMLVVLWILVLFSCFMILVPLYISKLIGINPAFLMDFGWNTLDTTELGLELFCLIVVMLIVGIQFHYVHYRFLALVKIKKDSTVKQEDVEIDVEEPLSPKSSKDSVNQAFQIVTERFLVFLDLNLNTFLLLCLLVLFVSRICAVNLVLLLLVVISLMFGRTGFKIMMHLVMIIISIIIVLTAVYQLNFFHHQQYSTTCLVNATVSNSAEWLGFYKKTGCLTLFPLLYLHILAMILATMKAVVSARLMYKHCQTASTPYVEAQVTFPDIKRSDADISIPNCMKYLLNYGFYMFGTEICLSLMSVMVALSLNCMGPLYLLWLWTLTFHQQSRWLWVTYQLFISAIVILQYAALVGLPPSLCRPIEYPWKGSLLLCLLGKCFLLLNEKQTTQINMFIFNFIMLMAVSRLNFCIRQEKKWIGEYPGGTNKDITEELENKNFVNPVPDHTSHMITWLDVTKNALFHMHLLLLLLLFFTSGLLQFTPFTPVYLIIAFHNFQKGYTVYLYPLRHIQKRWNKIIIILLLIITCKIMIRIFLMIFSEFPYHYCSFLQNLQHISRNYEFEVSSMNITINGTTTIVKKCSLKLGYNTVFWDSSIYMILLLLKRFCRSCYVLHHIMDSKALLCLSSRGLELMEQMWIQRQHETKVKEEKHLLKIRIASQQARRLQKQEYHNMLTHIDAVRSGDYTLFDFMNVDEEELPEKEETEEKLEEILDSNRATLGTFLEMACEKGTCRAAKLYLKMQDITFKQKEEHKEIKEGKKKKRFFIRIFRRMWFGIIITWAFLTASVESVILFLNTITYTYLKIRVTMLQERRLLKQLPDFQQQGSITGHNTPWRPMQSKINVNQQRIEEMKDTASDHQIREEHIKHMSGQIMLVRLIMALLNVFLAYSDLICYLMIFVYHMVCASLMTLPLPFLVLMWGALARPRPTETFWTVLTTYAEILLIFDWVLKFDFMPMKKENPIMKTFYPSRIVGMQIKDSQVYDLLLLCSIYFHHHMRNILGMRRAEGEVVSLSEEKFILDSEGLREATDDVEIPKYYTTRQLQTTSSQIVLVHTEEHGAVDRKLFTKLIFQEYCKPVTSFFFSLLHNDQNSIFDMYVLMFLCDLCIFLIYIIEYNSFGQDVAGSSSMNILKSNSVPVNMVFLLFSHFLLILIERMLYLQRKMIYTILFHLLQVLMWHVWLFFILPSMTDERYQQHFPRQACYLLKCFYFLLGTYQIRNGPPSRILTNCVCKHYTMLNKVLHQAYLQIPFLYEMRTLTDWIWTDTSFTLYEWLKFEDIFANVFQRKCSQDFEVKYSKNRGTKTKKWVKYSVGISLVFVIIVLLWFPVTMYAFIRLGTKSHLPLQVTLTMRMGSHANLYRSCATGSNIMPSNLDPSSDVKLFIKRGFFCCLLVTIHNNGNGSIDTVDIPLLWIVTSKQQKNPLFINSLTSDEGSSMDPYHWSLLPRLYRKNLTTKAFLKTFRREDVTVSELTPYSDQEWLITPPDLQKLKEHLKTGEEIEITFQLEIMRHEVESYGDLRTTYVLSRYDLKQKDQEMILLLLMNNSALPVVLPYVLPKFIYVMNSGKVEVIYYFMDGMGIQKSHRTLKMNHHDEDGRQWWGLHEDCNDHNYHKFLKHWYEASSDKITIIIFNEGAIPDIISLFSQSGTTVSISFLIILSFFPTVRHKLRMIRMLIETMVLERDKIIGLYLGFVYLCFRGFRFMLGNLSRKIVYTDMPYVDRILQLCQDLYLVRERREYDLEEQLYAKLLFLYRSPETIIRYTRYPQHWRQDKQTS